MTVTLFKQPTPVPSAPAPAQPGADFSLDAYADIETGARLIGQRAASQLREIVQRRQSA